MVKQNQKTPVPRVGHRPHFYLVLTLTHTEANTTQSCLVTEAACNSARPLSGAGERTSASRVHNNGWSAARRSVRARRRAHSPIAHPRGGVAI